MRKLNDFSVSIFWAMIKRWTVSHFGTFDVYSLRKLLAMKIQKYKRGIKLRKIGFIPGILNSKLD